MTLIIFIFLITIDNDFNNAVIKNKFGQSQSACKALDFMKLQNKALQKKFFLQLDSIRNVQYPNSDQETEIMVDINSNLLTQFLKDIDQTALSKNGRFEKEYHFNIAPKGFSDPKTCTDKISIEFYPEHCSYQMIIWNTFLVEPDWCSEHQIMYSFEIKDNRIINFRRDEAG